MRTPDGSKPNPSCKACKGIGRIWDKWIKGWNNCGCAAVAR